MNTIKPLLPKDRPAQKPQALRQNVEVAPSLVGWKITCDGVKVDWFLYKRDAVPAAIDFCRQQWKAFNRLTELIIKDRKGVIREKNTYPRSSDDPKTEG